MPRPFIDRKDDYLWRNKHENVRRQVARLYTPWNLFEDGSQPSQHVFRVGLDGLQTVIREAQAAGRRLRPLGGSWSLSEVAATNDFLVDTKALNVIQAGLPERYCSGATRDRARRLVFVQGGASVLAINNKLEAAGLSLRTAGASNGQTFAGAISTGTHGSAHQVGAMQDTVLGLHVLRENGEATWLDRGSSVSAEFLQLLGDPTVVPDPDHSLFRAALVGVGTFGFIHGVLLEAEPIYLLERHVRVMDLAAVRPVLATLDVGPLGLAALPFHFEVVINPYATGAGENGARVRFMHKRPFVPQAPPADGGGGFAPGDDLLAAIGVLGDLAPAIIPAGVARIIDLQVPVAAGVLGTPGQTFNSTTIHGAGTSIELGVPLADAERALDVVLAVARAHRWGGIVALRYVKSTDALLGFTRFEPITCTIEIPSVLSARSTEAFERIVAGLAAQGIRHALHWGQALPVAYGPAAVQASYGPDAASWMAARQRFLPALATRWMFSSQVLERAGLAA